MVLCRKICDCILVVSFFLFNEEGEVNILMVDVVNVIEISFGNFYYYFYGKDEIIVVLFDVFEVEIK